MRRGRSSNPWAACSAWTCPCTASGTPRPRSTTSIGAVPRHAPMLIWTDPVRLPWSEEERRELGRSREHRRLLEPFPAGVHGRPEGAGESPVVLLIWTYDVEPVEPVFPIAFDPAHLEILIRGMSRIVAGVERVFLAAAERRRRRRLLHEDPGEPVSRRAPAGRGRLHHRRALRLRAHVRERRRGSPRGPHHRAAPPPVCARPSGWNDTTIPPIAALLAEWEDSGQL